MAGDRTRNGRPLMYRNSQYASKHFGIEGSTFTKVATIPKPKFLFFVKFVTSAENNIGGVEKDLARFSDPRSGIVFQIKQIDRPKFNIRTETLLQYNKKRVIQTRIDYNPMSIAFHDDVSDRVMNFWKDYYEFYYGDGNKTSSVDWLSSDIVRGDFHEAGIEGWGYKGQFPGGRSDDMHFLDRIELFQFYGGNFTKITYVHPKISSFDHDENDYTEGSVGSGIRMTFDFEGVIYDLVSKPIANSFTEFGDSFVTSDKIDEFGFASDYFDPETGRIVAGDQNPNRSTTTPNFNNLGRIENPAKGITGSNLLRPSGAVLIAQAALSESLRQFEAGNTILQGTGFTFGTGALTGLAKPVVDFRNLTALAGNVPTPDLDINSGNVANTINNFGTFNDPGFNELLSNPRSVVNAGIDSTKVAQAATILNTITASTEQSLAPGLTQIASRIKLGQFSQSLGAAATLAERQGIVDGVASFPGTLDSSSIDAQTMVNKLPSGNFQLTNRGSAVLNSLRSPTSAVGSRRVARPFAAPNTIENNRRALALEKNQSGLIDV